MKRKQVFLLTTVLIVVIAGELIAWGFFTLYGKERLRWNLRLDTEAIFAEAFSQNTIPVRREFLRKSMPHRPMPKKWDRDIASAYGDSFTFGTDVADHETWPYYLSITLNGNVFNYGGPGFGPDEAVLKLEDNLREGKHTKFVILSILSENIGRVVSSFPKLFFLDGRVGHFKPIIIGTPAGVFNWEKDYLSDLNTEQGKQFAIELTKKHDFWYAHNTKRLELGFPYFWQVVNTAYYLIFQHRNWADLWEMDRPPAVMQEIIARFYALSQQYKFTPMVVFIPGQIDTLRMEQRQRLSYAHFVVTLREDPKFKDMKIIDIAEEFPADFPPRQFNLRPHTGHASPAGNRLIAAAIARHMGR